MSLEQRALTEAEVRRQESVIRLLTEIVRGLRSIDQTLSGVSSEIEMLTMRCER